MPSNQTIINAPRYLLLSRPAPEARKLQDIEGVNFVKVNLGIIGFFNIEEISKSIGITCQASWPYKTNLCTKS
jgi:hypothetical protein